MAFRLTIGQLQHPRVSPRASFSSPERSFYSGEADWHHRLNECMIKKRKQGLGTKSHTWERQSIAMTIEVPITRWYPSRAGPHRLGGSEGTGVCSYTLTQLSEVFCTAKASNSRFPGGVMTCIRQQQPMTGHDSRASSLPMSLNHFLKPFCISDCPVPGAWCLVPSA